jgi:hypothetical protein
MKKFKVTVSYITYCTAEVEAEDEDQAYEIARDMDGGDFTESRENFDCHISQVTEIKETV